MEKKGWNQEDILYEDDQILVCRKHAGMAVQSARIGQMDMESALRNYRRGDFVGIVQRLDQPVEGVLVFGKTPQATAELNCQHQNGKMKKKYLAVYTKKSVDGKTDEKEEHQNSKGEKENRICLGGYSCKRWKNEYFPCGKKGNSPGKKGDTFLSDHTRRERYRTGRSNSSDRKTSSDSCADGVSRNAFVGRWEIESLYNGRRTGSSYRVMCL